MKCGGVGSEGGRSFILGRKLKRSVDMKKYQTMKISLEVKRRQGSVPQDEEMTGR